MSEDGQRRMFEGKLRGASVWALEDGWDLEVWGVRAVDEPATGSRFRTRGPRLPLPGQPLRVLLLNVVHLGLVLRHPRHGVLLATGGWNTAGAALALRVTGRRAPLVLRVNIHSAGDGLQRRGHRFLPRFVLAAERYALRTADVVVTVGASTTQFARELGVATDRIVEQPRVVAKRGDDDARLERVPSRDAMLVVCAARLEPRKAVDVLLHAFARVVAAHPEARLEVAGEGSESNALGALTTRLGLDRSVVFRGGLKQRDMPDFYARASVFVLPSRGDEGLPKVVVEAALAGCAVVGTEVRGTTELVVPGVTGELVPPDDPVALGRALTELLGDPVRVARLAAAAGPVALAHQERAHLMGNELERRIRALVAHR